METQPQKKTSFFQLFMSIWFHPRATIRSIVETNPRRNIILLACISGIYQTLDRLIKQGAGDSMGLIEIGLIALIAGPIAGLFALFVGRFLFQLSGKIIGGKATGAEVRSALAWSSVPDSILLLLFIPYIAFLGREGFTSVEAGAELTSLQAAVAVFYAFVVALPLVIWKAFISVQCMAEVHQFAWWKGVLTYVIGFAIVIIPIVVLLRAAGA